MMFTDVEVALNVMNPPHSLISYSNITNVTVASLIYASAFIGYIASPLHLCYVYTAEYYKVPLIEGYKYMIPATIASLAIAITLFSTL
jgi:hypothetical protein